MGEGPNSWGALEPLRREKLDLVERKKVFIGLCDVNKNTTKDNIYFQ